MTSIDLSAMETIKLVVVGNKGVGKTSLLITWTTNAMPSEYIPEVFDNYSANMMTDGKPYNLTLWDTAAGSEFDELRPLAYPETDIFFVCYSIVDRSSLQAVKEQWVPELQKYSPNVPYFLVGLKHDLRDWADKDKPLKDVITEEEGQILAKELGVKFFEVGLLNRKNLSAIWSEAIRCVVGPAPTTKSAKSGRCNLF